MWLCTRLKTFFTGGIGSSQTKVTNVWRSKRCMSENDSIFVFVYLFSCKIKKIINCPYFLNFPHSEG
jgi:hypothetical protein